MLYTFILRVAFLILISSNVYGEDACSFSSNVTNLKLCRYRDEGLLPYEIWKYKTGVGCYMYLSPRWFTDRIHITSQNLNTSDYNCTVPVGIIPSNKKLIPFDYQNNDSLKYIFSSFQNSIYFSKWKNCAKNADLCCTSLMNNNNIIYPNDDNQCPATWDAWSCFDSAKNGSISKLPCPDITSSSKDLVCTLYSEKECFPNGSWYDTTNYATCASAPVYRRRHNFHVIILYVSLALSLPAVCIFVSYKSLRILRVNLHRNLLIACILRNIFTILTKELVILDSLKPPNETNNVLNENGISCRVLAYFNSVFTNAIYACMLIDGYYLHKLIVRIFNSEPNVYILYFITIVLSFLPTTIWAIVVAINSNNHCWVVDDSWYQWIPDGFRIAILCVNVILLSDIIRVLCKKLKKNVTAQETKSTLKATLFLLPLFGVPFILTANRSIIDASSCRAGDIYYYVSYSIQALQSVMVAILFCYWNKEVHTQIKKTFRTLKLNECCGFKERNVNRRRDTAATYVANQNSVVLKAEARDSKVKAKVNDWLTDNPIWEDSEQQQTHINHFDDVSKYIDDSIDNSNTPTLDNNNLENISRESVDNDNTNRNVKFVEY